MDTVADFFQTTSGLLLAAFVVVLVLSLRRLIQTGRTGKIPSVSVSLGVVFTFIGIFIALLGFDVSDIQGSIPDLLNGMRLAFASSICGMIVAVTHRVAPRLPVWTPTVNAQEETDAITTIERLNQAQARRQAELAERLDAVETALAGDGDTTLLTQLQKLRTSFVDKQDEMIQAFNSFAEKMAEDQTEALIEALEDVIRDFNAKINEQFGENFKHLNEAVEKLVDWQKEYKEHVETMTDRLDAAVQSMEASEKALERISTHSERFGESAERLEDVVTTFKNEIDALEQHLEAFADLSEKAENAFPTIKKNLEDLTESYRDGIESTTAQIEKTVQKQRESVSDIIEEMKSEQERLHKTLQQTSEQTADNIREQIETLDEELGNELNKALSSLGSQLTSLSEKFVDDYEPLTKELREVVRMSRNIRKQNGNA